MGGNKKFTVYVILYIIILLTCFAQANAVDNESAVESPTYIQNLDDVYQKNALLKVDYLQANLLNNVPNMGLVGLHYEQNLLPLDNLYSGIGMYGAITGNTGGYFAFGVDNDYFLHFEKYFALNPGLFAGGGGGKSGGFGGGLILVPHIGVDFNFLDSSSIGLNYSYVSFPNSIINSSSQLMLSYMYNFDSYQLPFASNVENINTKTTKYTQENVYLEPVLSIYKPENATSFNNTHIAKDIVMPGIELGYEFNDKLYTFIQSQAAANGGISGYMELLTGIGYQVELTNNFSYLLSLGLGSGGGGNINTGGGFLVNPNTGLAFDLNKNWVLNGTVGYIAAPQGSFNAITYNAGLEYNFSNLTPDNTNGDLINDIDLDKWRGNIYNQTLANRGSSAANGAVNLVSLEVDQFFTDNFYLNYGTGFAYEGQQSGGLAIGSIGPGYQINIASFHPYIEVPFAVMGGGGIKDGQGFVAEPTIGSYYDITNYLSFMLGIGMVQSIGNYEFSSPIFNAGVSYRFAKISSH